MKKQIKVPSFLTYPKLHARIWRTPEDLSHGAANSISNVLEVPFRMNLRNYLLMNLESILQLLRCFFSY
ncbi:hypothetical protein OROMI_016140 [Orobanche minor]